MANESGDSKPSTSSESADSYIGSLISLTSKFEIRYEGVLCFLDPQDSTLGLQNVRSFGTEGRKKDGPQIPQSDKIYEYILFRGSDIKDLQVKSSPPSQVEEPINNDPAIIQSQCAAGPASLAKSSPNTEASVLNMSSSPSVLPSHQSGPQVGTWGPSQITQNADFASYGMPMHWPGYNLPKNDYALQHSVPSTTASFSSLQNYWPASPLPASGMTALTSSSNLHSPMPALAASSSAHSSIMPILNSEQLSTHPADVLPSLSMKSSVPFYSAVLPTNQSNVSSFPSSGHNGSKTEALNICKVFSDPVSLHPAQSLSYSAPSIADSTSGPLLKAPPLLLTPDQFSWPKHSELSSVPNIYPDQWNTGVVNSASSNSLSLNTSPAVQTPLLPLQPSSQQFTEEFDFEAMNERFKKDEVWGYLGKAMQRDKVVKMEDSSTVFQSMWNEKGDGSASKADSKPAYNKDEFFDTISCNSTSQRARNGQNRFSNRMKLDTETFGNVQHPGYAAGQGLNHERTQHRWGRGYNSRGRGWGGYMHS